MLQLPLSGATPAHFHILQNAALIALAVFFAPLCTFIATLSHIVSPFTKVARRIKLRRQWRASAAAISRPRTVLVTGVGMSKGLTLARDFYRAGHRVIGADFEPYHIPVCGHFSKAIERFYKLSKASADTGCAEYIKELIAIIQKENVELWVSCSAVASAVEDGEAAEAVQKETSCKPIQFGVKLTGTLHEKDSFIKNTRDLGLNVPETHVVTSVTEALAQLHPEKLESTAGRTYIMKSVGLDDSIRADMTVLPRPTHKETEQHIRRLNPTPFRPFVLQQYISGPEYCTHSLIINGKVKAFVACPSTELLMHHTALPANSALSQAMLLYTNIYAKRTGSSMTGHFSIDFLVEKHIGREAEMKMSVSDGEIRELMNKIYPIECNPRAHTAAVLFADEAEDLAEAYLSILPDHEPKGVSNGHRVEAIVVPKPGVPSCYWIGHDLVTLVILPLVGVVQFEVGVLEMLGQWLEFLEHVLYWRDGTFEIWDPWPAWSLYIIYWPGMFLVRLWERRWWSRCNVSTTKMFGC